MIVRGESTIIDYHAPFDQGFKEARKGFFVDVVFAKRLKITKKDI